MSAILIIELYARAMCIVCQQQLMHSAVKHFSINEWLKMYDSNSQTQESLNTSKSSNSSSSKIISLENSYEKIRTVGKGAFGTAILYRRISDSKLVILKEIDMTELNAAERQMALNEVEVLSVLHHPNIISYLGSFEINGMLIIEMEYADGGTLSQFIIKSKNPINELEIWNLYKQIVAAIQYMHEHNILHRDLKTANVFLTKELDIKVGDFGISKVMNTKSQAQTVLGTPYYISPEMCEGKQYDEKSDMWALGCILYELACREKTFQGSNLPALVNKIMKGSYEPLPTVYSSGMKLLVSDLLQKDPALRPPASVVLARVNLLYEKMKKKFANSNHFNNYKNSQNVRSVLYNISGHQHSFSMKPIDLPPKAQILSVAIGATHYVALTSDMLVYTWGEGKRGQLGLEGSPDWIDEPKLVECLVSKSIHIIAAGNGFSVFVSDSGMILTCGDGSFGTLGHGDWETQECPKLIEKLLNVDIVHVSSGESHVVILTRDGELYTWGMLPSGNNICSPGLIEIPNKAVPKSVVAGPDAIAMITNSGSLFVCGNNTYNKLGLDLILLNYESKVRKVEKLTHVKALKKWFVIGVSIGRNHSVVLTKDGYVITMGSNLEAQLGHNQKSPSIVSSVTDRVVTMVTCGPTYTIIGTEENAIYFWGTRFTQIIERSNDSARISMSTLESQVVKDPQEVLMLYASPEQISKGQIVKLNSICALWHCIFVLVDTTAPLSMSEPINPEPPVKEEKQADFDTSGPVPDWIKKELSQATHEWVGGNNTSYKQYLTSY
ncbi:serine/threonine-protein kinase Nek8-like isoform X2 [Cimex lectularius]|uniref:non-specific serine/threonine protein kinase n=1 Tax=Cimex lectularius TaxID=79782 RepID=A0A8I6RLJ8_CIMLE|nr:serine/threonine-protein kinase Nek8-like isoform X2 [Cimex lectularius]